MEVVKCKIDTRFQVEGVKCKITVTIRSRSDAPDRLIACLHQDKWLHRIFSRFWWVMKQLYLHMEAMQLSWPSPSSWQFGMWLKHGILLFGQEPLLRGRSSRICWWQVSKASRRSQSQLRPCFNARKIMRSISRHTSEGSCVWEHKRPQCPMKLLLRPWLKGFCNTPGVTVTKI